MAKKRCLYCGKIMNEPKTFCSERCKEKYDRFEKYVNKNLKKFILGIVTTLVFVFVGMIISVYYSQIGVAIMMVSIFAMFINMLIFPFSTPETIKLMGIRNSIITVRILVAILLVIMIITSFI